MPILLRRFLLWTFICCASAAPSFALAQERHDRGAMIVGVCLFIAVYTASTSTAAFGRLRRRPFVRRTLYIGYTMRLILSALFPLGVVSGPGPGAWVLFIWPDIWPGLLSLMVVGNWLGLSPETFEGTLATTIVQGTLLNVIIFGFMLIVYAFQRQFMNPPPEAQPRGFEVVLPAVRVNEIGQAK